jgi:hypothetical protein
MKKKRFKAELQPGHKENALEVPFDPVEVWGVASVSLWRGRRGHRVLATLNGVSFKTVIVPRQQTFFILVSEDIKQEAGVAIGELVEIRSRRLTRRQNNEGYYRFTGFSRQKILET